MKFKAILFFFLFTLFVRGAFVYADKAPDFTLQNTNGEAVSLSDYKGKVVFLDFWTSWCPPCRASIPAIKELHKNMSDNPDVEVIGINNGENEKTVVDFMKKMGMDYPNLYGTNAVAKSYDVSGIPAFFIIDKEGNIVKKYMGYKNGLEKEWYSEIEALLK